MDEILAKYLLSEASENEKQQVESWIRENPDNKKYFDHFRIIWDESRNIELKGHIDENEAWQRFETLVKKNNSAKKGRVRKLLLRMTAAACLLVSVGVATYYFYSSPVTIESGNEVVTSTLPDQSVVTLNKNSTLSYSKSFNRKGRQVKLSGEAFFKVTPDKIKPFEIRVNDVTVTVVGTSFNVKSNNAGIEVIVETGIVTVQVGNKSVRVMPHQKTFVPKDSQQLFVEQNQDELYNYYRVDEFVCNNTPLSELINALNENYGVHISILNPEVGRMRLTTRFSKESLDDILKIISQTLGVTIDHNQKNEIIIK